MFLDTLNITRNNRYGFDSDKPPSAYEGTLKFINPELGEIKLNLSPEMSARILEVVADEIVASAQAVSTVLTTKLIRQHAQLKNDTQPDS